MRFICLLHSSVFVSTKIPQNDPVRFTTQWKSLQTEERLKYKVPTSGACTAVGAMWICRHSYLTQDERSVTEVHLDV